MLLGSELVGFYGEDCFNGALVAAENAPGTQNFGPASKRQPIHGYQDQKLAPEANAGKPHCPCDGTRPPTLPQPRPGRPRHRSSTTSPLRTAQHPFRPARDVAPRQGQPTGRPPVQRRRRAIIPKPQRAPSRPAVSGRRVRGELLAPRARNTKRQMPSRTSARRHLPERSDGCFPRSALLACARRLAALHGSTKSRF